MTTRDIVVLVGAVIVCVGELLISRWFHRNRNRKDGEVGMKCFPLDCTTECPHYKTWDMSVDDWTSVCDILKVQVDDCDGDYIRYRCPLDSDKRYQNALQEGR